mgnify:CR=1 FL=1
MKTSSFPALVKSSNPPKDHPDTKMLSDESISMASAASWDVVPTLYVADCAPARVYLITTTSAEP